jgi:hypothetical protein
MSLKVNEKNRTNHQLAKILISKMALKKSRQQDEIMRNLSEEEKTSLTKDITEIENIPLSPSEIKKLP